MSIHLTFEQERIVYDELKSDRFRSAAEVIATALATLREKGLFLLAEDGDNHQESAVREMLNFVEENCTSLQGISVKQLIREGRRL